MTTRVAFIAIVAVGLAVRLINAGADPPLTLSRSNAEIMDGPWYLAEAIDRTRDLPTTLPVQYRRPIFTAIMSAGFVGGASLARAHVVEAVIGTLLIVLAAAGARRAFGMRAALWTAFLVGTGFVFVGYSRTTVVYGPLAAGLSLAFWILAQAMRTQGRQQWVAAGLALALVMALALGLQAIAVLALPAFVYGVIAQMKRPLVAIVAAGIVAAGAALLVWAVDGPLVLVTIEKARAYFGTADAMSIVKRWSRAPFASGLWPEAPLVCVFGGVGVLTAVQAHDDDRVACRVLSIWLVIWIGVLSVFEYTEGAVPLRYFMPGLVPAAILSGRTIDRLAGPDGVRLPKSPVVLFAGATLGFYWALGTVWTWIWPMLAARGLTTRVIVNAVSFEGLLSGALFFGAGMAWAAWRGHTSTPLRAGTTALALILSAGLARDLAGIVPMLARPTYTLSAANTAAAQLVGPGAAIFGPFAHALTYDAPGVSRHMESFDYRTPERALEARSRKWTHLAVSQEDGIKLERTYSSLGAPLVWIGEVALRGDPIRIYRFPWATELGYRLSPLEQRLLEMR